MSGWCRRKQFFCRISHATFFRGMPGGTLGSIRVKNFRQVCFSSVLGDGVLKDAKRERGLACDLRPGQRHQLGRPDDAGRDRVAVLVGADRDLLQDAHDLVALRGVFRYSSSATTVSTAPRLTAMTSGEVNEVCLRGLPFRCQSWMMMTRESKGSRIRSALLSRRHLSRGRFAARQAAV